MSLITQVSTIFKVIFVISEAQQSQFSFTLYLWWKHIGWTICRMSFCAPKKKAWQWVNMTGFSFWLFKNNILKSKLIYSFKRQEQKRSINVKLRMTAPIWNLFDMTLQYFMKSVLCCVLCVCVCMCVSDRRMDGRKLHKMVHYCKYKCPHFHLCNVLLQKNEKE